MANTKIGAMKVAAKLAGIPFEEYCQQVALGFKRCGKCKKWVDRSLFHIDRSRGDGLSSVCKSCRGTDDPQHPWRGKSLPEAHKEKIKETLLDRYKTNTHHLAGRPSTRVGFRHSLETRQKISAVTRVRSLRGPDAPNYKDGKAVERRGLRFSAEYKRWRFDVYMRDKFTCQSCGDARGGNLVAHHVKHFADYPELRFEVSNGITLCVDCHKFIHAAK